MTTHLVRSPNTIQSSGILRETWCGLGVNFELFEDDNRIVERARIEEVDCDDCLRESFEWHAANEQTKIIDHPTRHMVDIPIPVQLGETIQVNGYDFVVTGLHVSLDEPPFLVVKSPQELQKKIPSAPNLKNFFEGVSKAISEAAEKQRNKPVGPFKVTPPIEEGTDDEGP